MKKTIKIEILLELPEDVDISFITPKIKQTYHNPENAVDRQVDGMDSQIRLTLSVQEVAKMLGISETTIYAMVRLNEIPHKKVRGRILFHRPSIERWLQNKEEYSDPLED